MMRMEAAVVPPVAVARVHSSLMLTWLSLGLAAIVLLLPQENLREFPSALTVWGTSGVSLVFCLCLFRLIRRGGGNPWATATALTMAYYVFRYAWGAIVIYYWEDFPWQSVPALRMRFHLQGARINVESACLMVLLGAIGLFAGSVVPVKGLARRLPNIRWPIHELGFRRNVILYSPVALFVFLVLTPRLPLSVQFAVSLLGQIVYLLNVIVGYWLFTASNWRERLEWGMVAALLCITSLSLGFMTGQVGEMLAPFVFIVFGYLLAHARLPWRALAVLVPAAFLVIFPFLTIYKDTARQHRDRGLVERLSFAQERFGTLDYRTGLELTMDRFVARMAATALPAIFSRFYPDVYPYDRGRSFAIEFSSLVPRVVWPDKPRVSVELNRYSAGVGLVKEGGETSAVFDAVTEYYVNFGNPGVFALCFLHGLYLNTLGSWFMQTLRAPLGGAMNMAIFFGNPEFFGFGQAFSSQIKVLPVWILVLYFLSRRTTRTPA